MYFDHDDDDDDDDAEAAAEEPPEAVSVEADVCGEYLDHRLASAEAGAGDVGGGAV